MTSRVIEVTVGSQYYSVTGYTYYGYDSGPNLFYGDIRSNVLVGTDGEEYIVHGIRWAAESPNSRVYLRLDNPTITSSQSYTVYKSLFTSVKIGSVTLNSADIVSGFTVDGGVGLYWNRSTNPFGSVGSTTTILFNGVSNGPYGLEIYNSSGVPVVTLTDRLVRYVSYHEGSLNAGQTTTIAVPGLTNDGTWGFNSEGAQGTFIKATQSTGLLTLQNIHPTAALTYNIQVFRV